jgi:hypothetical protein
VQMGVGVPGRVDSCGAQAAGARLTNRQGRCCQRLRLQLLRPDSCSCWMAALHGPAWPRAVRHQGHWGERQALTLLTAAGSSAAPLKGPPRPLLPAVPDTNASRLGREPERPRPNTPQLHFACPAALRGRVGGSARRWLVHL